MPLSDRQLEILAHYANGFNAPEMTKLVFLSENTIHNYMKRARKKTGALSINQLIVWCIADGSLKINSDGSVVPKLEPNEQQS